MCKCLKWLVPLRHHVTISELSCCCFFILQKSDIFLHLKSLLNNESDLPEEWPPLRGGGRKGQRESWRRPPSADLSSLWVQNTSLYTLSEVKVKEGPLHLFGLDSVAQLLQLLQVLQVPQVPQVLNSSLFMGCSRGACPRCQHMMLSCQSSLLNTGRYFPGRRSHLTDNNNKKMCWTRK